MKFISVGEESRPITGTQVDDEMTAVLARLAERKKTMLALVSKPVKASAVAAVAKKVDDDVKKLRAGAEKLLAKQEKSDLDVKLYEDRKQVKAKLEAFADDAKALAATTSKIAADKKSPLVLPDGKLASKYKKVVEAYFDVLTTIIKSTARALSDFHGQQSRQVSWIVPTVGAAAVAGVAALVVSSKK